MRAILFLIITLVILPVSAQANIRLYALATSCQTNHSILDLIYTEKGVYWIARVKATENSIEIFRRKFKQSEGQPQSKIETAGSAYEQFSFVHKGVAKKNYLLWREKISSIQPLCGQKQNNIEVRNEPAKVLKIAQEIHRHHFVAKLEKPHKRKRIP